VERTKVRISRVATDRQTLRDGSQGKVGWRRSVGIRDGREFLYAR